MAQNTAEDTNPSVGKTESSEVTTCATNKTVPCDQKEKIELIDADTAELTPIKKQKVAEVTDSHDSKEQSDIREDDCNGDPEEEPTLAKEAPSMKINQVKTKETKEDNPAESHSAEAKSSGAEDDALIREEEKRLNEILKVVHADLDIKYFQKSAGQPVTAKSDDVPEKEQQAVKAASAPEKRTTKSAEERIVDTATVQNSVDEKKDSRESSEKAMERSEVGIVGPPTAVSELINEEELGGDSALSADPKDHIAEWVENSVKADAMVPVNLEEEDNAAEERNKHCKGKNAMDMKMRRVNDALHSRKSQRIVSNIIKKSIKCLNRMHALMSEYGKNVKDAGKNSRKSPKASPNNIPQSQQNGAALPEEASTSSAVDKQSHCSTKKSSKSPTGTSRQKTKSNSNAVTNRKRKPASEEEESIGELPVFKKCCLADREKHIENLVGQKEGTSEEFARRAEELRLQIEALDQLAHNKEKEWNNILSMRKLKEEAYLRLKRMTEVANFMESGNNLGPESVPLTNLWVEPIASGSGDTSMLKEKSITKENLSEIVSQDSMDTKKHNIGKVVVQQETASPKNSKEDDRKQGETSNTVTRKLTEGRQGTKVPVQSIIDDYRSRNPEIVPRRGRRMRNSVNVGLTAGGAMVETGHNVDSRPSSTDSSKSNSNAPDSNNPMSFKDVLIQFARMSQQGEPIKTPQNYPDVTLHPVPPSTTSQSTAPQQSASLLHGILTKAQTPKPATFSPTLAKLLTAPERERSSPTATAIVTAAPTTSSATIVTATAAVPIPQQGTSATQHLLQAYHGSNLGAISELLSSSKARSEITITPVVNPPASQSHSNNVIHVEDVEEESAVIDDREGRYSAVVRDNREERDNPRCQGCQDRAAQFVCAGCGNQWYCSRDCQVAAWDEHSEVCSG